MKGKQRRRRRRIESSLLCTNLNYSHRISIINFNFLSAGKKIKKDYANDFVPRVTQY